MQALFCIFNKYIALLLKFMQYYVMKNENTSVISRVTDHFGSGYAAAKALQVKHQQWYAWVKIGYLPFKRGKQIEELTNGAITAMEVWEAAGRQS
jgi:hypothetical protein